MRLRESFGQVVMAMMSLPRYRHQSLGDLPQLVMEPLIRDRIAIARSTKDEPGMLTDVAGFAVWASVSEEVDLKIRDQNQSGDLSDPPEARGLAERVDQLALGCHRARPQDHGPGHRNLPAGGEGRRPAAASPDRRACRAGDAGEDGRIRQGKGRRMTYQLYEKPLGHTSLDFDFVDGDMKKVENEDRRIDIGINPPDWSIAMRFGRRVKTEFLPTRIRPTTNQNRMPDFAIVRLAQICSAKFRDVVEILEPGVHQFVPVEVVRKNGDHVADMFWFVPCNRLDTLELELLYPPVNHHGRYRGAGGDSRIVFSRSRIGDHHVWIDKRVISGFIWVSDKFHDAAVEAGLIGLNLVAQETV